MEITLEKIELVKDRTGVSYKEAKEALEGAEGSVVDAIIAIEESIDKVTKKKVTDRGMDILTAIKELIAKGNVAKVVVKKTDGEVLVNLPVNASIIAAIVAPWGVVAGVVSTFAFKCIVEVVKDDGTIIDVSDRANDVIEKATEKGSAAVEAAKVKAGETAEKIKNSDSYEKMMEKAGDAASKVKDVAGDAADKMKVKAGGFIDKAQDKIKNIKGDVEDIREDLDEELEEIKADIAEELGTVNTEVTVDDIQAEAAALDVE